MFREEEEEYIRTSKGPHTVRRVQAGSSKDHCLQAEAEAVAVRDQPPPPPSLGFLQSAENFEINDGSITSIGGHSFNAHGDMYVTYNTSPASSLNASVMSLHMADENERGRLREPSPSERAGEVPSTSALAQNTTTSSDKCCCGRSLGHEKGQVYSEETLILPALPVQRSCDIYRRHLATKGRGIPLYNPGLSKNLPIQHQRKGISIGDLGIVTESGSYIFLFNFCLPKGHPTNPPVMPEGFEPLVNGRDAMQMLNVDVQRVFEENSYLASASSVKARRDGDSTGLIFESSEHDGAILTMPVGSKSEDLVNKARFQKYVKKNLKSWYHYAYYVRDFEVRNGDLRVVTGCDKTSTWGMATFFNSEAGCSGLNSSSSSSSSSSSRRYSDSRLGRGEPKFHLEFGLIENGAASGEGRLKRYGWECSGMAEVRAGPDARDLLELRGGDVEEEGNTVYENQCLFVRTMNATLPEKVWEELGFDNDDEEEEEESGSYEKENGSGKSVGGNNRASSSSSSATGGNSAATFSTSPAPKTQLSASRSIANDYNATSAYSTLMSLVDHPSIAINDLLLKNCSDNTAMAITLDEDWMSVLREDDFVMPSSEELVERIMKTYNIREEDGVVFLGYKSVDEGQGGSSSFAILGVDEPSVDANEVNVPEESPTSINVGGPESLANLDPNLSNCVDMSFMPYLPNIGSHCIDPDSDSCCHKPGGRNLVVCIDGTSNKDGSMNTNVIELYRLISKDPKDKQRAWYNSGIGTYAPASSNPFKSLRQTMYHSIDSAIAWNFEKIIFDAYEWLSDNYEPDDCIFLFGFSRGAYQVRVLSAMIDKVGLIIRGNKTQIPFAYELYTDPKSYESTVTGVGGQERLTSAQRFKEAFCFDDVKVHFVGAWDTVSALGLARKEMLPGTVDGMQHVCYFRHALALDERRVKFLPEYAYGQSTMAPGVIPEVDKTTSTVDSSSPESKSSQRSGKPTEGARLAPTGKSPRKVLEVWFPGTHSDIGGGNTGDPGMGRGRPPLRWMVSEAGAYGLRTRRFERELSQEGQFEIKVSLTRQWWPLEFMLNKRPSDKVQGGRKTSTIKPHLGLGRKIQPGQKIHSSFILTKESEYVPKARPPNDDISFWSDARENGLGDWLEIDLDKYAQDLVDSYLEKRGPIVLCTLYQMAKSTDGRQAVCENLYPGVIRVLDNPEFPAELKYQTLQETFDILKQSAWELKRAYSRRIRELVLELPMSDEPENRKISRQFLTECTDACVNILEGHEGFISSVAFSPDSKSIVSGSNDNTLRLWNADTGKAICEPFKGHTGSVVFSPDGKHVASGSFDKTARVWNADTGMSARGHMTSTSSLRPWTRNISNLFALVIGIDLYESEEFHPLNSAIRDASRVQKYLTDQLSVPESHIRLLTGQDASRLNIIEALKSFKDDPRIEPGDPIFIFYAGHGHEILAPPSWMDDGQPCIPDRTIGAILKAIAGKKGNNITVVLDCCHSASGTRGHNLRFRSGTKPSLILTEDLDRDIWSVDEEISHLAPQFQNEGLLSHTLIAACGPSELAAERDKFGNFSKAFLDLLYAMPPDEIRYSQILKLMNSIKGQNPQIEGVNLDRFLFNVAPPTPLPPADHHVFFDKKSNSHFILVGTAHGVTEGTVFDVKTADSTPSSTHTGTVTIVKTMPFRSIVKSESREDVLSRDLLSALILVERRQGVRPRSLRLYVDRKVNHDRNYQDSCQYFNSLIANDQYHTSQVVLVDQQEKAHFKVSVDKQKVTFQLVDGRLGELGHFFRLPRSSSATVASALQAAAECRWELERTNEGESDLLDDIGVSIHFLKKRSVLFENTDTVEEMMPFGKDLFENNQLDVVVQHEKHLGFKITNTGDRGLYPVLQYFDFSGLGKMITLYQPPTSGPSYIPEAPLREDGGSLTIGYGAGGMPPLTLSFQQKQNIIVGYLKLSLFTQPLDFGLGGSRLHQRQQLQQWQKQGRREDTWATRIIPVTQRRFPVQTPSATTPLSSHWPSPTREGFRTFPEVMMSRSISTPVGTTGTKVNLF